MRKARVSIVLVLALVFSFSAFGEVGIMGSPAFGIAQGSRAASALARTATGPKEVFSYSIASGIGGVLFQATALPRGNAVNQPVSVSYNPAKADGQRLAVTIGGAIISPLLYDWQFIPVARYADSEYNACITLLGQPTNSERITDTDYHMYLEVHPAFSNTLAGFNLFLIDAMLVDANPNRMRRITGSFSETVRGYNDREFDETKSAGSAGLISRMLQDRQYRWDSYIYTDCGTDITYDVVNGRLVFTGVPSYQFFKIDHEAKTVTMEGGLNAALARNRTLVTALNPAIYAAAETTAQWAAFFRRVKEQNPSGWKMFIERIAGVKAEPAITVPRVWLRGE
jgi:hypothetical protein